MRDVYDHALSVNFNLVRVQFEQRVEPQWPRHLINEVELECRRLVILKGLYPAHQIAASGPVGEFWAAYCDLGGLLSESAGDFDEALVDRLYAETFGSPLPDLWVGRDMARLMDPAIAG